MRQLGLKMKFSGAVVFLMGLGLTAMLSAQTSDLQFAKVEAKTKEERSRIANTGVTLETIRPDYVIVVGHNQEIEKLKDQGFAVETTLVSPTDFPRQDSKFHNFDRLTAAIDELVEENSDLIELETIGESIEGRRIVNLQITAGDRNNIDEMPSIVFMGGHHAREHLSVEMPLMLAQRLVEDYRNGEAHVQALLESRVINIIPVVNPDGAEFDVASGRYKYWRKNRKDNGRGTYGVDLNRNYGFEWGTGGSSQDPTSDTYMGPEPFSEPETVAIRDFVDSRKNISILVSFHTFSELILYPWGHTYDSIGNGQDLQVHQTMAQTMAEWNGYTPQQSSDLYIASGDTTDWSYGEHGIISFTFELDPSSLWEGGFYPGQSYIDVVFKKNIQPALYLIEYADNPYRVLDPNYKSFGLSSPLVK